MELFAYARIFRSKFQKERFLCENNILLCVLDGTFEVKCNEKWVRVEEKQAFLFLKNKTYERRILQPMTMTLFRYESETPLFPSEHLIFADTQRFHSTLFLAEKCERAPDAFMRRAHLLYDLAVQYATEGESASEEKRADQKMLEAEKRMRESLSESISIPALADACALSHVQFIRRFRSAFGCTPSDHIAALRLERAKELLTQTTWRVKEIARACGFENEYYFSNFFKKHTALSPSAYRFMTV